MTDPVATAPGTDLMSRSLPLGVLSSMLDWPKNKKEVSAIRDSPLAFFNSGLTGFRVRLDGYRLDLRPDDRRRHPDHLVGRRLVCRLAGHQSAYRPADHPVDPCYSSFCLPALLPSVFEIISDVGLNCSLIVETRSVSPRSRG